MSNYQIFCRDLDSKTITINVNSDMTIEEVHTRILEKMYPNSVDYLKSCTYLTSCCILHKNKTLSECNVNSRDTLYLNGRLC